MRTGPRVHALAQMTVYLPTRACSPPAPGCPALNACPVHPSTPPTQAAGKEKLVDFVAALPSYPELETLRLEVNAFATSFPMPGFDVESMKYKTFDMLA